MEPNEQFMETKTHKLVDETFNFQGKEVLSKCTNNTEPIACHYYVDIDGSLLHINKMVPPLVNVTN